MDLKGKKARCPKRRGDLEIARDVMVMIPVYMGESRTELTTVRSTYQVSRTKRSELEPGGVQKALKEPAIACSLRENFLHRRNQWAGHYYRLLAGVSRVGDRDIE